MDKNVLIAIIGVAAAVITSVFSLITALLVTKRTEKSNQNLELLRLDQEQVKLLLGIRKETFEESLKALEEACVLIQKTRDDIRECLPKLNRECKDQNITAAQESCESLILFFQNKHYLLIPEHRIRLHEIKNISADAKTQLQNCVHHSSRAKMAQAIRLLKEYVELLGIVQSEFLIYRDKMIATISTTSNKKAGYR